MHNQPGSLRPSIRRARVAVKVLLLGVIVMLTSAGSLFAANPNGSQSGQKGIVVQVNPGSRAVTQGESVSYPIAVASSNGFSGAVTLSVSGLPSGATAAFSPASPTLTAGSTVQVTMTVGTSPDTPANKFDLTVVGKSGQIQSAGALTQLQVQQSIKQFSLSGNLSGLLAPGYSRALDLQIANPNNKNIALSALQVSIAEVVRTPGAMAANLPCTTADYVVTQYSGTYPLTAPPGASSLSSLRVPTAKWPQIRMLDTPLLQDGCKGATLSLQYSGSGQGN